MAVGLVEQGWESRLDGGDRTEVDSVEESWGPEKSEPGLVKKRQ